MDHICELPKKAQTIPETPLGFLKKFKETWRMLSSVNVNTPKCTRYMDSLAAVAFEKKRHAQRSYWWIVHPYSQLNFVWNTFMILVYIVAFFTVPFMICFIVMDYQAIRFDEVNVPIYIICWIDIFLHCITGYYDEKNTTVVLDQFKILRKYFTTYVFFDVISSLPYDRLTLQWRRRPGNSNRLIVIINLFPLLKVTRYVTLLSYIRELITHIQLKYFYYEILCIILLAGYILYWFSCLCYVIPIVVMHFLRLPPEECVDCWMTGLEKEGLPFIFQHALFMIFEMMSAAGYGLFTPMTEGHILLSSALLLLGRITEACVIIMILQIKAGIKSSRLKFQEIVNQLIAYTMQKQLPPHMKNRLLLYYHYRFKNSFFHEKAILSMLSEQLREEIALQSCRRLVENVDIFKDLPKSVLQSIVKTLKFELYLPNDAIVKAGTQGDCMFFLATGTVAVLTPNGKEICHLEDGAHFGEVALLVPDQRRVASIVAIEVCEVYRLDRKDFRRCVAVHSELFAKVERIAADRIERTVLLEEQHKRSLKQYSKQRTSSSAQRTSSTQRSSGSQRSSSTQRNSANMQDKKPGRDFREYDVY